MAQKTVADITVDTLQAAGVQRVYGLVGEALWGSSAAIRAREGLELVEVRQEEGGAFAAGSRCRNWPRSIEPAAAPGRKGLSLYEQRMLVNGRGSELLEMA